MATVLNSLIPCFFFSTESPREASAAKECPVDQKKANTENSVNKISFKIFFLKKLEILQNCVIGSTRVYRAFEKGWSYKSFKKAIPDGWKASITNLYLNLEYPYHFLNSLSLAGAIIDTYNIIRNLKVIKLLQGRTGLLEETQRFDSAMNALRAIGSLFENLAGTLSGLEGLKIVAKLEENKWIVLSTAMKTATATAQSFLAFGTLLSITDLIINARNWQKTDVFLKQFLETSGYKENGIYKPKSYDKFERYLKSSIDKDIKQHFMIRGKLLRLRLLQICQKKQKDLDCSQIKLTMSKLKRRLESSKTTHYISILSDVSSILSKTLIISGLFNPLGFILLGGFTLGRLTVFAQKKWSAYVFEHQIGVISNSPENIHAENNQQNASQANLTLRIKIFFTWFFGFHKYIAIPAKFSDLADSIKFSTTSISDLADSIKFSTTSISDLTDSFNVKFRNIQPTNILPINEPPTTEYKPLPCPLEIDKIDKPPPFPDIV
jgi:hypothetical protein